MFECLVYLVFGVWCIWCVLVCDCQSDNSLPCFIRSIFNKFFLFIGNNNSYWLENSVQQCGILLHFFWLKFFFVVVDFLLFFITFHTHLLFIFFGIFCFILFIPFVVVVVVIMTYVHWNKKGKQKLSNENLTKKKIFKRKRKRMMTMITLKR